MRELLRKYRRDLHQIPEPGHHEFKTQNYLLNILQHYPCEITEFSPTGLCAFFPAANPRYAGTVALRSEMDGFPIQELSDVSYRSRHDGMMHACGHDGNMAMLLGMAGKLAEISEELPINVLLIFQPAEEGPGGARYIADSGIMEKYRVCRIFAFHMGPSHIPGAIMGRPMEMMSKSCDVTIYIDGKSVHIANTHTGIDALHIGCMYLNELYEMEQTILPPEECRLLRFGKVVGGSRRCGIAERVILEGSLRAFREETCHLLLMQIRSIASAYEEKHGCTIHIDTAEGYLPVLNDPQLYEIAKELLSPSRFIGAPKFVPLQKPSMISDDYSYYLRKVPGLLFFLGTGNLKPLYSNDFDFDEDVLEVGVRAYLQLILESPY